MSQSETSVLLITDPLLRQSVEAMGMPEKLKMSFPEGIGGRIVAGGLVVSSVFGVYVDQINDKVEAALDNRAAPGQTDCVTVGNPGDVALTGSTIVEPQQPGFATVGPSGYDWRAYSTNNYGVGGASPNLTATKVGPDGKLCTTAQQSAHKLLDIVGFIDGDVFTPYNNSPTPTRIMDTRQEATTGGNDISVVRKAGELILQDDNVKLKYCRYFPFEPSPGSLVFEFTFSVSGLPKDLDFSDSTPGSVVSATIVRTNISETYYNDGIFASADGIGSFGGLNLYEAGKNPPEDKLKKLIGEAELRVSDYSGGNQNGVYDVVFDVPCSRVSS